MRRLTHRRGLRLDPFGRRLFVVDHQRRARDRRRKHRRHKHRWNEHRRREHRWNSSDGRGKHRRLEHRRRRSTGGSGGTSADGGILCPTGKKGPALIAVGSKFCIDATEVTNHDYQDVPRRSRRRGHQSHGALGLPGRARLLPGYHGWLPELRGRSRPELPRALRRLVRRLRLLQVGGQASVREDRRRRGRPSRTLRRISGIRPARVRRQRRPTSTARPTRADAASMPRRWRRSARR